MVSVDGIDILHQTPPMANAVVYKSDDKVIAKRYNEKHDRWDIIAKGTAGIDDASVIQNAIDSITKNGGGKLYILNGEYILTNQINLNNAGNPSFLNIEGIGKVLIKPDGNFSVFYKSPNSNMIFSSIKNIIFTSDYESPVIDISAQAPYVVSNCIFENLRFENISTAIKIQSLTNAGEVSQNSFRNIKVINAKKYALYCPTYGINQSTFESFYVDKYDGSNEYNNMVYIADGFNNWFGHLYLRGGLYLHNTNTRIDLLRFENITNSELSQNDYSLMTFSGNISIGQLVLQDLQNTIDTIFKLENATVSVDELVNFGSVLYSNLVKTYNPPFKLIINSFNIPEPITRYITGSIVYDTLSNALHSKYIIINDFQGKNIKNYGTVTITADGSTTTFTIPHDLISTPNYVNITPINGAPYPDKITADATNITLTFNTAPASGTYEYWWEAKL